MSCSPTVDVTIEPTEKHDTVSLTIRVDDPSTEIVQDKPKPIIKRSRVFFPTSILYVAPTVTSMMNQIINKSTFSIPDTETDKTLFTIDHPPSNYTTTSSNEAKVVSNMVIPKKEIDPNEDMVQIVSPTGCGWNL